MKRAILQTGLMIIALAILAISGFAQQGFELGKAIGATGNSFISYGGGFAVTPPAGFSPFKETTEVMGDKKTNYYINRSTFSNSSYGAVISIYYIPLPADIKVTSPQQSLEQHFQVNLKENGFTLQKREMITVQGYPAILFQATVIAKEKQFYVLGKTILTKGKIYDVLLIATDKMYLDQDAVQKSFKSFSIF
jgi:hypothetical protein